MQQVHIWNAARIAVCILVAVYIVAPIVIVLIISFSSAPFLTFPPPGWSMQWYENIVGNPAWIRSLWVSLRVMLPAGIAATVLGTAAAFALNRGRIPGAAAINGILMAPLVVPVIITAAALFGVFRIWGLYGTIGGLILAHTVLTIPYVLSTVGASLQLVDRRLEDAAANLGATPWMAFRSVTLPLILPAVLSGLLFAMVISFDELVVSLFISTPVVRPVTVQMWSNIRGDVDPTIAAIATLIFLFSLAALLVESVMSRSGGRKTPFS
ncbi:MAG: ABC transporter permease [Gammaproteobacteria bacterium]|nr:ABC transporter permease [Gammaproteobacteria bacterium]